MDRARGRVGRAGCARPIRLSAWSQHDRRTYIAISRLATVLGYPRIGPRRELKRALESFWDGRSTGEDLHGVGFALQGGELASVRRAWPGRAAVQHLLVLRPGARHGDAARRGAQAVSRQAEASWKSTFSG